MRGGAGAGRKWFAAEPERGVRDVTGTPRSLAVPASVTWLCSFTRQQ